MKLRLLLALLACFCASLFISPLAAQGQPPLTLEVHAGYDPTGQYRVGYWFPTRIIVANDGPDLRGKIEWSFPGTSDGKFNYELDLPRGARKAVVLPVVTMNTHRSATVSLIANQTLLARTQTRLEPIDTQQVTVGVISSEPTLLNSLAAATLASNTNTPVVHLDPTALPEDASLLAGLEALFIHDLATANLTPKQLAAIELWTSLGGQLVVGGGASADKTTPGLAALLPVEVGALRLNTPLDALIRLLGRQDLGNNLPATTASAVTLRAGTVALDRDNLLTATEHGAGRVIFAAFDLAALRSWTGEVQLWQKVLSIEPRMSFATSFRGRNDNVLRSSLNLPMLRLPSTSLMLLLMAGYIFLIGPANFLVLRKLRRIELAWITTPLLVLLFTATTYAVSLVLRGNNPQISQLTLIQSFEGQRQGQLTAFLGVFSPQRRAYRLDFSPEALVTPGTLENFRFEDEAVTSDGSSTSLRELLIDVSSLRTLLVETPTEATVSVESQLSALNKSRVQGKLRLTGSLPLRDARVVIGSAAQELGNLQPGVEVSIDLRTNLENFLTGFVPDKDQKGLINHREVLTSLFSFDRFALGGPTFEGSQGLPEGDAVYLVGWSDSPTLASSIDGAPANQQGETLHFIRLKAGS